MNRFAVIVTHNRPILLAECVAAVGPQVDMVIVIDNASQPPVSSDTLPPPEPEPDSYRMCVVAVPDQPPNLARFWNLGMDVAGVERGQNLTAAAEPWHIAVLCDDAIVPPGWFAAVTAAMAETGAAIGCSDPWGNQHPPRVKTERDGDLMGRMPGWAWIVDASKGLHADESMSWWWCDTDLDWQARAAGGMVTIGGFPVPNRLPNDFTCTVPGLSDLAGRDGEAFVAKYGTRPW